MSQEINDYEDSYERVNVATLSLIDRVQIIHNKIKKTPWYRIGTLIKLWKELKVIAKETDKVGERLKKLDEAKRNPMEIVKRT